ncbi:OmpH family outer membrane protein [Ohtaekwangia koreensis]|jgi:outer membrane protein|uniref:Periplasmic chaperone for outer membrane proteins Skp n=1 Tax=Ohtaekwangia koreensis TaxID=688867 RepID=A0A1T5M1Z3_9BACT|nr:OmpH family outer membrane protein [Ohtaekwangia koreensis]SKC82240.1 periplasmic chaperone for outer membrane proteins Skp [Ohtaekwangia koreensis]
MKNLSLILNIVLLVAVGVLFYLHFSSTKPATSSEAAVEPGDLKVAYINSDTVLKYYDYLKNQKVQLEDKSKKIEQEYRNRAMGLQNEITAYQRNVNSMTLGQAQATEEDLRKKQQNLQLYQQNLGQQLMEEEAKLNRELYQRVTAYLKKYGTEKGLQVVLKYDPTSDVLFAGEALDITKDVIAGLNTEYTQEATGVKTDTTAVKK